MKQPILSGTSVFWLVAFLPPRISSLLGSGVVAAEVRQIPRAAFERMREFSLHLKAGANKAEALRQVQLLMLQRHPHPYYWAAYELIGEAL